MGSGAPHTKKTKEGRYSPALSVAQGVTQTGLYILAWSLNPKEVTQTPCSARESQRFLRQWWQKRGLGSSVGGVRNGSSECLITTAAKGDVQSGAFSAFIFSILLLKRTMILFRDPFLSQVGHVPQGKQIPPQVWSGPDWSKFKKPRLYCQELVPRSRHEPISSKNSSNRSYWAGLGIWFRLDQLD